MENKKEETNKAKRIVSTAKASKPKLTKKPTATTRKIWDDLNQVNLHNGIIPQELWQQLNPDQAYFLPFLLTTTTYTVACREARIPEECFSNWYGQHAFRECVNRIKSLKFRISMFRILEQTDKAIDILIAKMDSKDEKISLQAAVILLEKGEKIVEYEQIDLRIARITEQLGTHKPNSILSNPPIFLGD